MESLNSETKAELGQVINDYGYLVKINVGKIEYRRIPAGLDKSDLEQEGYIELMRCWRDYKNGGPAKFITYASKCIGLQLKTKIGQSRWGPIPSEVSRRKKAGKEYIKDMLSYDSFENFYESGEPRVWIDSIEGGRSAWAADKIKWRDKELLLKINVACHKILAKDKYNTVTLVKKSGKFEVQISILGVKLWLGKFHDKEEAAQHKQDVIRSIIETIDYELLYAN